MWKSMPEHTDGYRVIELAGIYFQVISLIFVLALTLSDWPGADGMPGGPIAQRRSVTDPGLPHLQRLPLHPGWIGQSLV